MDFRARLQKAAERGQSIRDKQLRDERAKALSEEEYKRLHSGYRLPLCDNIEECLKQLADNVPGFRFETVMDESGWGAAVSRDDIGVHGGKRDSFFSRLRLAISPFSKYHVLELSAKGTVRNKESFSRNHYQQLDDVDEDSFRELIELWVLDYAEAFAAAQ